MSANDLPGERWRPIAGFEDAYEVSDLGRVRSLEREVEMAPVGRRPYLRVVPRKLLGSKCMRGRPRVALFGEGRRRLFFVADLVAEAFLGERPEGKLVLLRDGGPDNVAVGNLFYGDLADREAGKRRRGTTARGIRHGRTHLDDDDVRAIRAAAGRSPQHDLAVRFGVCEMTIRRIQQGRMWRHVLAEPNRAERPDHPGSSAPDPDASADAAAGPSFPCRPPSRDASSRPETGAPYA